MIDAEHRRRDAEFHSLRVFRWIEGKEAEDFVNMARTLAQSVLGVTVDTMVSVEGRDTYLSTGNPFCKVKSADELRAMLLERRDVASTRPESRFANVRKKLRNGVPVPNKQRDRGAPGLIAKPPLLEDFDVIEKIDHDISEDERKLKIVSIGTRTSGDTKNRLYELTLLPDITTLFGRVMLAQSVRAHQRVSEESSRVAYPSEQHMIDIPFATMLRNVPIDRIEAESRFHRELRGLLPLEFKVGEAVIE